MVKNIKKIFNNKFIHLLTDEFTYLYFIFKWTLISFLIAFFIGSASALFLISLNLVTNFRESNEWIIYFLPLAGFFIGLLYYYFGKIEEQGNNLLIDVIHSPKARKIPLKMAVFVYLGTITTHLFGGSAGREGTALQMAGSIADQFSKALRLKSSERVILIIMAISAGFGSVFGTPLAGAIFGLEFYRTGKIRYNAIFPALLCSIVADYICKIWGAHHTNYSISSAIPKLNLEIILYTILVGIIFGLCALFFSKFLSITTKFSKKIISYEPFRPFFGGIFVILGFLLVGTTKYIGLGIPTIEIAFQEQLPANDFILKIIFTIITLSAGFKGGEVTPLFFIGATLGSFLSFFVPLPIGLLAGMGFVAVFSGATNTPIACSIMAMELFGSEYGIFTSIACVVAYLVSGHTSIYGKQMVGEVKNEKFIEDQGKRMNEL